MNRLHSFEESWGKRIDRLNELTQLENLKTELLGRKGKLNLLFKKMAALPLNQRKDYGQALNRLKIVITDKISAKEKELLKKQSSTWMDLSLPGKKYPHGSLHPLTTTIEEISRIFSQLGFIRVSYPEVEWEYFSFEALNMPSDHPARDDFETFFIDRPPSKKFGKMVLTPHTSSGQIREMERIKPPIRMINIGRTYRRNWDATHVPMFYQFEGLCIDKNINLTHLKGTIDFFVKRFFGEKRRIRLRPFHFRFTEPSFEIDVTCGVCNGTGYHQRKQCKVCREGWLELGGAGMVHPNVLRAGGIDSDQYSGWAFGFGPERCLMMRENLKLDDIRILYSGDIRFLEKF